MPNYSFSRLERAYVQAQPVFGTIPNTSGTATVAASNAIRFIRLELQNEGALLERPDKTGTRSQEGMTGGRKMGRWSLELSTVASGTPGTPPDCDPIYQAMFGQTAAVGSGTAAITSSSDATPIVVTCSGPHGITSGAFEVVSISGHTTNVAANGVWYAYANSTTQLTLVGSVGDGLGAGSGGTVSRIKLTYTFVDAITQFTLWSFRQPATLDQRVGNSCTVTDATFALNQDVATWSAGGDCQWVVRSQDFSNLDTIQKGGLSFFPTEPASQVTNGSIIPGFTGRFVAGQGTNNTSATAFATSAATFPTVRNVTIRVSSQNLLVRDTFGSYYPTFTEGDVRVITMTYNVYDDDSVPVNTMKSWADSKTTVDFVLNLGTAIGNTYVFILKNVYLANSVLGDGQLRFDVGYGDSRATTSNLSVRDEFAMVIA